jgi:hypothetical protein
MWAGGLSVGVDGGKEGGGKQKEEKEEKYVFHRKKNNNTFLIHRRLIAKTKIEYNKPKKENSDLQLKSYCQESIFYKS